MDTHFPGSVEAQLELEQYYNEIVEGDKPKVKLPKIPWIDKDRVRRAISSFSDFKACWPDGIKPIILKHFPDKAIDRLVAIYTSCASLWDTR